MKILGLGRALPEQVITNRQLESILDTSDEWIQTRTGIRERRVMAGQDLTELACKAAEEALLDAGLSGADIDLILVATTLGDYLFPSLASLTAGHIGATCPAIDLHAACTGFLYALQTADAFLHSGKAKRALVIGAEAITRLANWQDRSTCVLFGDGAGALVLEAGEGLLALKLSTQTDKTVLFSRAPQGNCPYTGQVSGDPDGLAMAGQDVFRYAVSQSEKDLRAVLDLAGLNIADVDWVLLHQANRRILDTAQKRLGIPPEKMPGNIHRTGNTSAASIPLLLYELYHTGKLLPGHLLALGAFGAGLTSGACLLRWHKQPPANPTPAEDLFGG